MSSFTNDIVFYFFISIAVGLVYSIIAYSKKNSPWSKTANYILALVRFITVSGLTFLLFSPKISRTTVHEEKPLHIFLEDNSNSIPLALDSTELAKAHKQLKQFKTTIDGDVVTEKLIEETNNTPTTHSPISQRLLQIKEKYQGQNLQNIFLVSDGINNTGSPIDQQFLGLPVHTIALGKQITQRDAYIKKVNYNRSVYLGNDFLIKADLTANGYEGQQVTIELKHKNTIIDSKIEKVVNNSVSYSKLLHAEEKGKQQYNLHIKPLKDELTLKNNKKIFFVNVVSDQKKILIYAQSPHPNIKMLRNIIDKDERYTSIVKFSYDNLSSKEINANLYIYCGSPTIPTILAKASKNKGTIHLPLGSNKKLDIGWLSYQPKNAKPDNIQPLFNAKFSSFLLQNNDFNSLSTVQPLSVPFGEITLHKGNTLLYQKIGTLETQKPLICIQDITLPHHAFVLGEGWWRMKLHENNNDTKALEELFFKLMDFCTSTKNEEGLHFSFDKNTYYDIESPQAQAYFTTKSGERKHNLPLSLQLVNKETNKVSSYSFILFADRLQYNLNTLPKGSYKYTATVSPEGKAFSKTGTIVIEENHLESTNLNLNETGLRQLATNNKGQFAFCDSLSTLNIEKGKTRLSESIAYEDVVNYKWIFALLLLLLFGEWIIRKLKGSY